MRVSVVAVASAMVLLVAAFNIAGAQGAPTGDIRGRVVNSASNTPLAGITIDLTAVGASPTVGRATSGIDGAFRISGLKPARYAVHIRALGYAPYDNPSVTVAATSVDIGTIKLTNVALSLESVAITEKRQDVQLAPDRNTYVVRDMPTAKGGNALDVLRTVPAVDVDIDNVVSLRGNSGVTVQINGRPSPLKPAQLGDFLAQIPADMVDKVEIIPNPSARDDPTGVAGIINIVLKEEVDAGTNGGATIAGATNSQATAGVNLGYERRALSLFGSYGFLADRRPRSEALFRANDYLTPRTYLDESSVRIQSRQVHTLTGSAGYKLTGHDDVSLDLLFSNRHDTESNSIAYRTLDANRALTRLTDRVSSGTNQENDFEGTIGIKHAFAEKGHKLSVEAGVNRHTEGGPSSINAHLLSLSGAQVGITDQELQNNLERPTETSFKVDYTRPIAPGVRMETGYKGAFDHFHTGLDTRVFDSTSGAFVLDASRTSDFTYRQDVNAAYAMLTGQHGNFQLQGGTRVERAVTQFHVTAGNQTFDNAYNSVFPSALVAYTINEATQVKASYSARIRRPDDADLLDPIPHYQDPLNLSRGNPYLQPEHTNAFELGLQRSMGKTTLQVTPFFRRTLDAVATLRTIDSAGVTTRTFANIATRDSYGGDATLALSGTRLSGFVGSSAFRQVTNASNVSPDLSIRTFGWRARANGAYRVTKSFDVQALFSYQAAQAVEQGTNGSRTQFNLAARQKLMEDQLSVTLRVIDPFDTSHERGTTVDPRFFQTSDRARAIRGLMLSASWTFGKPDKSKDAIDLSGDATP